MGELYNFVKEECQKSDGNIKHSKLYSAYRQWCTKDNSKPIAKENFVIRLTSFGIKTKSVNYTDYFINIDLTNPNDYNFNLNQPNVELFVLQNCKRGSNFKSRSSILYTAYLQWCHEFKCRPVNKQDFKNELEKLYFFHHRESTGNYFLYIALKNAEKENKSGIKDFILKRCIKSANSKTKSSKLYNTYLNYCMESKEKPVSKKTFKQELEQLGFFQFRASAGMFFRFIELKNCT